MEVQRSRLLRALVHVVQMVGQTDELMPFLEQLGRDHRKFGVLAHHYDAVGAALISGIEHFSGDAFTPEVKAAWTEAYGTVANAMRAAAAAERGPASWLGRVVEHRRIGWDLARITVQASEAIPFRAGPVRERRDAAAAPALALPLACQRATPRRLAGVPRARRGQRLGQQGDRRALPCR